MQKLQLDAKANKEPHLFDKKNTKSHVNMALIPKAIIDQKRENFQHKY